MLPTSAAGSPPGVTFLALISMFRDSSNRLSINKSDFFILSPYAATKNRTHDCKSAELSKGLIEETLTTELQRPRDIIHLKLPSWRLAKWVSKVEIFWAETWSIETRPERKLVGRPLRARIDNFEAVLLLSSRLKPATLIHKSSSSSSSSVLSLDVHRNTTSRL